MAIRVRISASHRRGLDQRSHRAVACRRMRCAVGRGGRLSVGSHPARNDREQCPVRHRSGRGAAKVRAGRPRPACCRSPSVTPEPARRLDAVQFGKIKRAYLLQLLCRRGLRETGRQVVEPSLIFILEVEQSAYRILPELRSRVAVLRPAVMQAWLLCLAAITIAPLSLGVGQSHGHCAPLRNGSGGYGSGLVSGVGLRSRYAAAGGGRAVGRSTR